MVLIILNACSLHVLVPCSCAVTSPCDPWGVFPLPSLSMYNRVQLPPLVSPDSPGNRRCSKYSPYDLPTQNSFTSLAGGLTAFLTKKVVVRLLWKSTAWNQSWPTLPPPPPAFPGSMGVEVRTVQAPMPAPRVQPAKVQPASARRRSLCRGACST